MQQTGPNPAQQALMAFLQGNTAATAPLISPTAQAVVQSQPKGKANTLGNAVKSFTSLMNPKAFSSASKFEDASRDYWAIPQLERAMGQTNSTIQQPRATTLSNQAPQLYWGSMLQPQQNPNIKF